MSQIVAAAAADTARHPFGTGAAAGNTALAAAATAAAAAIAPYTAVASKQPFAPVCKTVTSLEEPWDPRAGGTVLNGYGIVLP